MKRLTPYSWLILIIFSSCLTGNKVAITDKQIESLLSQMTLEEKIGMLHSNTMFQVPVFQGLASPTCTTPTDLTE